MRFRVKALLVVLALIAVSCQCSMACAIQRCHGQATSQSASEQIPPCHQHPSKQSKSSDGCLHAPLVLERTHTVSALPDVVHVLSTAILPAQDTLLAGWDARRGNPQAASCPPSPDLVATTNLRI